MTETEINAEKPNRMTRRRLKTRQQLLDAAVALVIEKGFDDTNTDEITDAADVGRRTFYNHFDNKRDCILAAVKERFSAYAAQAASPAERQQDPVQALTNTAVQVFNQIAGDPVTRQLINYPRLLAEAVAESQREFLLQDFIEGLAQGRFKPLIAIEVMQPVLLWGFVGLVIQTINQNRGAEQGRAWARVMLSNLGVAQEEIDHLLQQTEAAE